MTPLSDVISLQRFILFLLFSMGLFLYHLGYQQYLFVGVRLYVCVYNVLAFYHHVAPLKLTCRVFDCDFSFECVYCHHLDFEGTTSNLWPSCKLLGQGLATRKVTLME